MQFILSSLQLVLYRVAAVKRLPVHHYIAKERGQCCTITLPHMNRNDTAESAPGPVAQSVGYLTRKSGVLGSIPGLATCFRFSFRFFKKGSCQLLAKVCALITG